MATADSSGVDRRYARMGGNTPHTQPPQINRRRPPSSKACSLSRKFQDPLIDTDSRLVAMGILANTAKVVFRTQSCKQASGIAQWIRFGVIDAMTAQVANAEPDRLQFETVIQMVHDTKESES